MTPAVRLSMGPGSSPAATCAEYSGGSTGRSSTCGGSCGFWMATGAGIACASGASATAGFALTIGAAADAGGSIALTTGAVCLTAAAGRAACAAGGETALIAGAPCCGVKSIRAVGAGAICTGGAASGFTTMTGSTATATVADGGVPAPSSAGLMRRGGSASAAAVPAAIASKASNMPVPNCPRCD